MGGEVAASKNASDEKIFHSEYHEDVARLVHSPSFRRLGRKHQLLSSDESDFVRTRSSHSNEVAQIATLLGTHLTKKLNAQGHPFTIKSDLLVFAGLAHDLGHPPFGHLGEQVLNDRMVDAGGFEGNAQTLRILTSLEKRFSTQKVNFEDNEEYFNWDKGYGINPTCRAVASVLKYSEEIGINEFSVDSRKFSSPVKKGYYTSEAEIVTKLIDNISDREIDDLRDFKTIEADIMDYADDIAYSIYDLEDSFKSGVLRPEDILGIDSDLLDKIADDVRLKIAKKRFPKVNKAELERVSKSFKDSLDAERVHYYLVEFFRPIEFEYEEMDHSSYVSETIKYVDSYRIFSLLCSNDQVRRSFTEAYIRRCVFESDIVVNEENLPLSRVYVPFDVFTLIEILKRVNYYLVIKSSLIRSSERRSEGILFEIFDRLYLPGDEFLPRASDCPAYHLLPYDTRRELDKLFSEKKVKGNRDIFHRTDKEDKSVESEGLVDMRKACEQAVYRLVPVMTGFNIYQILRYKDFIIRNTAAFAVYQTMRNHGCEARAELLSVFNARRVGMKRMICDYIANMTDRSAQEFYDNYIYKE